MKVLLVLPSGGVSFNAWPATIDRLLREENLSVGLLQIDQPGYEKSLPHSGLSYVEKLSSSALSEGSVSEEVARDYLEIVSRPSYQRLRFLALKLLNRVDFSGTFRFLEREVYLQATIMRVIRIIHTRNPNLLVFPITPHEFLPFVAQSVAHELGVESLFFQPSAIAHALIPKTGTGRKVLIPPTHDHDVAAEIREQVHTSVRRLTAGVAPNYMKMQSQRDTVAMSFRSRLNALRMTVRWVFSDRYPNAVNFPWRNSRQGALQRFLAGWASRSLRKTLDAQLDGLPTSAATSKPFVLLALHYEPERTSLPEGLPVDYQGDLVPRLLALFPSDMSILVKEHYSQRSSALRGFLGRSPLIYSTLQAFPRTLLLDARAPSADYLRNAECVVTLGGTIGLEGVLQQVPVGYYGSPWWAGLPGTIRITKGIDSDDVLQVGAASRQEVLDFLLDLHENHMIPGIGLEDPSKLAVRLGPVSRGTAGAEAQAVAEIVIELVARLAR